MATTTAALTKSLKKLPMRYRLLVLLLLAAGYSHGQAVPRIEIEMDTTTIKANKELPQLLYIVPWKDTDLSDSAEERNIIIHNLFGEFYEPVMPSGDAIRIPRPEEQPPNP